MRQALGEWFAVLSGGLRAPGENGRFSQGSDGGRTCWAHFEFTRKNIEPTILRKKIEDLRELRATGAPLSATVCSGGTIQAATHF
jgi:hypothetical protein